MILRGHPGVGKDTQAYFLSRGTSAADWLFGCDSGLIERLKSLGLVVLIVTVFHSEEDGDIVGLECGDVFLEAGERIARDTSADTGISDSHCEAASIQP